MKKLLLSIFIATVLIGCNSPLDKEVDISQKQDRNGIVYVVNGEKPFSGKMIGKYENGQIEVSEIYKDGKFNGEQASYYSNGQIKEKATYDMGVPVGEYVKYYSNGTVAYKGSYVNGVKDGDWNIYNDKNELLITKKYQNGELVNIEQHVVDVDGLKSKIESLFN